MRMTFDPSRLFLISLAVAAILSLGLLAGASQGTNQPQQLPAAKSTIMWINPLEMRAGDPSVKLSFNAITSGVGSGLTGLIIESTTEGDTAESGGNKVLETGLQVPPGYLIQGTRVCYETSNSRSYITQTRLSQVQTPPSSAVVRLDDATDLTEAGPVCIDSQSTTVDPADGAVFLSLRMNFGNTVDRIVIRALGLHLKIR